MKPNACRLARLETGGSMKSIFIIACILAVASVASATCDVSELPGTAKEFKSVMRASEQSENVVAIGTESLSTAAQRCMIEIDIAFELGDGYYDEVSQQIYAIYNSDFEEVQGYLIVYGATYTEAEDQDHVEYYRVYFNALGQRVSKYGDY